MAEAGELARIVRIAYFTMSGLTALAPLAALEAAGHELALIVRPAGRSPLRSLAGRVARRLRLRPADPVAEFARHRRIPTLRARAGADPAVLEALERVRAELICVSSFPWLLPRAVLMRPPLGGINLHASLLPRHRGPLPLFWTYHCDDRRAGVSVHRLDERADAGALFGSDGAHLPRGYPVDRLHEDNARRGAALLVRAVQALSHGARDWPLQDESLATRAPRVPAGASMVDFEAWHAERVWHFLAGVFPRFREPLRDAAGRPVRYRGVGGHEPGGSAGATALGRVDRRPGHRGALRCRDGWVHLELER